MAGITPVIMPKWGLSMREGTLVAWLVEEGTKITVGMPILEVETDKIANQVEAPDPGTLRRKVASEGEVLAVKALLGVMAEADVSDADLDSYIASWVTPKTEEEDESATPKFNFVDVDGLRIRYARRGPADGVPIVLIHGFGGDIDNWLFNIDALAEKAPVIALDLPGHGQSAIRLPGATVAALGAFVVKFLDAVSVGQAHFVGHSLGGAIAAQIALDDPMRVASLTLIGSAGFGSEVSSVYIDGFARAQSRRELKSALELLFADPGLVNRKMVDDVLKYKRLDGVGNLLIELAAELFPGGRQSAQPGPKLAGREVAGKTLLIWGQVDRVVPAAHARNAPAGAAVEVLDGAGHMVQMERANDVNRLILSHIGF
jgi:pyruvate dehydrogenase E2 component (dihydrolipoamide acetyltransferase)